MSVEGTEFLVKNRPTNYTAQDQLLDQISFLKGVGRVDDEKYVDLVVRAVTEYNRPDKALTFWLNAGGAVDIPALQFELITSILKRIKAEGRFDD
jgi:hypothetical protein